ncbi:MAG: general secretion pathway protein GspK [Desulfobacteraceae bacterium]|nr:MAG: general secretion pathway protein GspK [Desulfobacteraceae bacterium]
MDRHLPADYKVHKDNKGIALILTLSVIVVLVAVTFELNWQIQGSLTGAAVMRDRLVLSQMIVSGVDIAQAILIKDKTSSEIDSVQEDWANPEKIEAYLSQIPFDNGKIRLIISDERGRIQVNSLVQFPDGKEFNAPQRDFWFRFMALILSQQETADASLTEEIVEPSAIINPVKDWLDSGDNDAITGLNGAENDYYKDLDPPYECRNGPFRNVEELTRVRGITPDLFYAADAQLMGISNYLTVYGLSAAKDRFTYDGKININTADIPVLAALLPIGQEFFAPEIFNYRLESADGQFLHELTGPTWYKEVPGCADVDIDAALITTQSDLFRIDCGAMINEIQMTASVVVERVKEKESGKWYCKVLNWSNE